MRTCNACHRITETDPVCINCGWDASGGSKREWHDVPEEETHNDIP